MKRAAKKNALTISLCLSLALWPLAVFAVDASSTNFILEGSTFDGLGGTSTSTTFTADQEIPFIAGALATSTSFMLDSNFLAVTSSTTSTTSSGGGGGGGGGGSSGGGGGGGLLPVVIAQFSPPIWATIPFIAPVAEQTANVIDTIARGFNNIFNPTPPPVAVEIPLEKIVPQDAPLALHGVWSLLPRAPLREYALRPLPVDLQNLAGQLPQLGRLFADVGINTFNDLSKLQNAKLRVPGLGDVFALPEANLAPGQIAEPVRDLRIAELTPELRAKFPTGILFTKFAGGLVDVKPTLRLDEKGQTEQVIRTVIGSQLSLSIRPAFAASSVEGYFVFKNRIVPQHYSAAPAMSKFTASVFAKLGPAAPILEDVETALVVDTFTFSDSDKDGIFTAIVDAPVAEGEYEIITAIKYKDAARGTQLLRMITVIDPTGYVYEQSGDKEIRIPKATVTLNWLNPTTSEYEFWPAKDYQQDNPQVTNVTGRYSFLVPPGTYTLAVDADDYEHFEGKPFDVTDGINVHENIPLTPSVRFWQVIDWKSVFLGLLFFLVVYHLYRDKIKESKK